MDLIWMSAYEARERLRAGDVSAEELTRAHLDRIEQVDEELGAFLTVTADMALTQARVADRRLRDGDPAPLLGVPIALKDLFANQGIRTTCASRILESFVPVEDGTVIRKLYDAGAVLLGKTNMDEFAMGSSNENSAFFPTRNPWGDLSLVPGGSSGSS